MPYWLYTEWNLSQPNGRLGTRRDGRVAVGLSVVEYFEHV